MEYTPPAEVQGQQVKFECHEDLDNYAHWLLRQIPDLQFKHKYDWALLKAYGKFYCCVLWFMVVGGGDGGDGGVFCDVCVACVVCCVCGVWRVWRVWCVIEREREREKREKEKSERRERERRECGGVSGGDGGGLTNTNKRRQGILADATGGSTRKKQRNAIGVIQERETLCSGLPLSRSQRNRHHPS